MPQEFEPKLSILPPGLRRLWNELSAVPSAFVLCGGTAIALQLGHRASLDFDFVSEAEFDPDDLYGKVSFLNGSTPIQKSASTLTCVVDRNAPVQISFFGTPSVRFVDHPLIAADNRVQVASLIDLSGMKAAVVQKRAEARDYIDIDAILSQGGVSLSLALAAARELYGTAFNPQLTLKSLCFFGDGNLKRIPREMQDRLAAAVNAVDLNLLPRIVRRPT